MTINEYADLIRAALQETQVTADAAVAAARASRRAERKLHKLIAAAAVEHGCSIGLPEGGDIITAAAAPKTEPD